MKKIKLPTPKAPKLPTPKAPDFLRDLVRDLRDRRLLPLIAVIIVAIVAVPFVLAKSSSSGAAPEAPAAGDAETAGASSVGAGSQLAVVEAEPGLRDYRRRLAGTPKNPFAQRFTGVPGGGEESGGDGGGEPPATGDSGAGAPPTSPDSGADPVPSDPGDGETGDDVEPEEPAEPEPAWVVTVRVSMGEETNVRQLSETTVLPGTENPLLVFSGLNEKGNKAVFRTGASVSAIFGDATCIKGSDRCEELEIEPGFPVVFVYGETERLYRLTVVDIEHNR